MVILLNEEEKKARKLTPFPTKFSFGFSDFRPLLKKEEIQSLNLEEVRLRIPPSLVFPFTICCTLPFFISINPFFFQNAKWSYEKYPPKKRGCNKNVETKQLYVENRKNCGFNPFAGRR